MAQFADHAKIRLNSQLINGISRVFQKLLRHFNGTAISTFPILPPAGALLATFALYLNDSESFMLSFG